MDSNATSTRKTLRLEHKHGLDEWSPMMPERSAQAVIIGDVPPEDLYRCQRVGCTEVVKVRQDDTVA